jgi:hypothetical protein
MNDEMKLKKHVHEQTEKINVRLVFLSGFYGEWNELSTVAEVDVHKKKAHKQ